VKISVVGSGYVGLVTAACLADFGNDVVCFDINDAKINLLRSGRVPFFEPGLAELIRRNVDSARLHFTSAVAESVAHGSVQFIAVGTPPGEDGSADLQYVLRAAQDIAAHMNEFKIIVNKSTVPIGTAEKVKTVIKEKLRVRDEDLEFSVVSNPEFLKEGAAIEDFLRPDRIVLGHEHDQVGQQAAKIMKALYAPFSRHHERILLMDVRSAEMTKYAANAMLATRISFMNELANLAEIVGADIEQVRRGIGSDTRIGYDFLYAGIGYGGSCFPKDIAALQKIGLANDSKLKILDAVQSVNEAQKQVLLKKIETRFNYNLSDKTIAIWGLSFKPNTDDMREAPSRVIIQSLVSNGAKIRAHDPVAIEEAQKVLKEDLSPDYDKLKNIQFFTSAEEALSGADCLVVLTEWKAYRTPNFEVIKSKLGLPLIFDGRNMYDVKEMQSIGVEYYCIGR
jgi:UDPglucose 6-dehydrogenase